MDAGEWSKVWHFVSKGENEIVSYRWSIASDQSDFSRCACRWPMAFKTFMKSWPKPPKDSKTRGMKFTPSRWHSSLRVANFLSSAMHRACIGVMEAHSKVGNCMGYMIMTLRAPGQSPDQLGRKMSAGWLLVPRIRQGTSLLGAKSTVQVADRIEPQIKLWWVIWY